MNSNEVNHPDFIKCTQNQGNTWQQDYSMPQQNMVPQENMMSQQNMIPIQKRGSYEFFQKVFLPSIIYALVTTFCRYHNPASILSPVWVMGGLVYIAVVLKGLGQSWNHHMYFPAASMVLLGLSSMMTTNSTIYSMNNFLCNVLLVLTLILAFYPEEKWQIHQWIYAFLASIVGAISSLGDWGEDLSAAGKEKNRKNGAFLAVLVGIGIAIPLTIVIVLLLASADSVFHQMVKTVFDMDYDFTDFILSAMMCIFVFIGSYCLVRYLHKKNLLVKASKEKSFPQVTAYVILLPLTLIYLLFSWIQLAYLLIGNMKLPQGMTYSTYAHQGFDQLLVVVVINLIVVLLIIACFGRRKGLQLLLTLFTLCTYVMIASAYVRIFMYIAAYSLTELRFLVVWGLSVMAVLYLMVLVYIYRESFYLARWFMVIGCLFCIGLSYCRMDVIIAKYNLSHIQELREKHPVDTDVRFLEGDYGNQDIYYMSTLSTDACDVIFTSGNEDLIMAYILRNNKEYLGQPYSYRMTNLSYENFKNRVDDTKYQRLMREALEKEQSEESVEE